MVEKTCRREMRFRFGNGIIGSKKMGKGLDGVQLELLSETFNLKNRIL